MCTKRPKIPAPTPVIERQAYRNPAPRDALGVSGDNNARRRRLMGVVTSAQGITTPASTTRKQFGGEAISPSIGGGGGASVATSPAVQAEAMQVHRAPTTGGGSSMGQTPLSPIAKMKAHQVLAASVFGIGGPAMQAAALKALRAG